MTQIRVFHRETKHHVVDLFVQVLGEIKIRIKFCAAIPFRDLTLTVIKYADRAYKAVYFMVFVVSFSLDRLFEHG